MRRGLGDVKDAQAIDHEEAIVVLILLATYGVRHSISAVRGHALVAHFAHTATWLAMEMDKRTLRLLTPVERRWLLKQTQSRFSAHHVTVID